LGADTWSSAGGGGNGNSGARRREFKLPIEPKARMASATSRKPRVSPVRCMTQAQKIKKAMKPTSPVNALLRTAITINPAIGLPRLENSFTQTHKGTLGDASGQRIGATPHQELTGSN